MKIAIIGGGWIGCHIANKFQSEHDIHIYEKNDLLFQETSFNNQNRLHLGYHYPRNYKTRQLCLNTFERFISEYSFLINNINKNLYCIEKTNSILDFKTYLKIFEGQEHYEVDNIFRNVEGVINTKEKQINFEKAHEFFNRKFSNIHIKKYITIKQLLKLSKKYDLIINCTNNHLNKEINKNFFFETTVSYLYEKTGFVPFDALTMVDGPFFSIYPYKQNLYTVTDVQLTPLKKFKNSNYIYKYNKKIKESNFLKNRSLLIETKIQKYYPDFLKNFKYVDFYLSTKSKIVSGSDDRYPVITQKDNIINCFTGKIQGIFIIEDYIKNEIINR